MPDTSISAFSELGLHWRLRKCNPERIQWQRKTNSWVTQWNLRMSCFLEMLTSRNLNCVPISFSSSQSVNSSQIPLYRLSCNQKLQKLPDSWSNLFPTLSGSDSPWHWQATIPGPGPRAGHLAALSGAMDPDTVGRQASFDGNLIVVQWVWQNWDVSETFCSQQLNIFSGSLWKFTNRFDSWRKLRLRESSPVLNYWESESVQDICGIFSVFKVFPPSFNG